MLILRRRGRELVDFEERGFGSLLILRKGGWGWELFDFEERGVGSFLILRRGGWELVDFEASTIK